MNSKHRKFLKPGRIGNAAGQDGVLNMGGLFRTGAGREMAF
jgi:hypothetical protein